MVETLLIIGISLALIFPIIVIMLFFRTHKKGMRIITGSMASNNTPTDTVTGTVISKRTNTSGFSNGPTRTYYYISLETENKKRDEFQIDGRQYGLVRENEKIRATINKHGHIIKIEVL